MGSSDQPRTGRTGTFRQPPWSSIDWTRVPGPDENAHEYGVLVAELATLNSLLTRYVLRAVDTDAGRAIPIPVDDELDLAERLSSAAEALCDRVRRREQSKGGGGACGTAPDKEN